MIIDYLIEEFFGRHVQTIELKAEGGYAGDEIAQIDLKYLERLYAAGGDSFTIVTGEGSSRDTGYNVGKSSFVVDLACTVNANTLMEKDTAQTLVKNKEFIESKTGALVSDTPVGITIADYDMKLAETEAPDADVVFYCFKDGDLFDARKIEIIVNYMRMVSIYGTHKVFPLCLKLTEGES